MRFQPIRDIGVSYERQITTFVTCLNYHKQDPKVQARIDRVCREVCAGDAVMEAALKELLTTGGNMEEISLRHYVSMAALSRRRAKFYKRFRP